MRIGNRLSHLASVFRLACALVLCGVAFLDSLAQTPAPDAARTQTPAAQTEPPVQTPAPAQSAAAPVESADLAITARVTARELKFNVVPNPTVEFTGKPRRETVWEAERQNLPQTVRPGETYRDIGITLRITSVFADIDRIVSEALGEIPISEDAPPAPDARDFSARTSPPQQAATVPEEEGASRRASTDARQVGASQSSSPHTSNASAPLKQTRRHEARRGTRK